MRLLKVISILLIVIISLLLALSTFGVITQEFLSESAKKWVIIALIVGCAFSLISLLAGGKNSSSQNDPPNSGPKF